MKTRKKRKIYEKTTSAALVLVFFVSFFNSTPLDAKPVSPVSIDKQGPSDFWDWKLPPELGTIELSENFGPASKTLVLIQDAHAVADAQFSIKKILRELERQGVRLAALEGTTGDLDPLLLRSFPDREILTEAIEDYVSKGELSGPAAAAILNPGEMKFTGVEDAGLFRQAIDLFLDAQDQAGAFKNKITSLQDRLHILQKKFNSPQLVHLLGLLKRSGEQPEDMLEIFPELEKIEKPSAEKYPRLTALLENLRDKKSENAVALEKELDFLNAQFLKQTKDSVKTRALNQRIQDFHTHKISFAALASFLLNSAKEEGLELGPSLALQEQARLHEKLESVRGPEFFQEFELYAAELKNKTMKTAEERVLDHLAGHLADLERFSGLELDRGQWAGLENFEKDISPDHFGKTDTAVRGFAMRVKQEARKIFSKFENHRNFYRNAELREKAILHKTLAAMSKNNEDSAALVLGGFHTRGFLNDLKRQKISYFLITPSIYQLPEQDVYKAGMRGQVSWSSYFTFKNGKTDLYDAFARAASEKAVRLYEEKRKTPAAEILKKWRDRILTQLVSEGRVIEARQYTRHVDLLFYENETSAGRKKISQAWQKTIDAFLNHVQTLKAQNELTPEKLAGWKAAAAQGWALTPLSRGVYAKRSWVRAPQKPRASFPPKVRSEMREQQKLTHTGRPVWSNEKNRLIMSYSISAGRPRTAEGRRKDPGIGKITHITENAVAEGVKDVHLLPHHAVSPRSQSPYAGVDYYSINELYIDWSVVPEVLAHPESGKLLNLLIAEKGKRSRVDYDDVRRRERQAAFAALEHLEKAIPSRRAEFLEFQKTQAAWLNDYAEFMTLLEIIGEDLPDWAKPKSMERVARGHKDFDRTVEMHKYAQWIAYQQLEAELKKLESKGIRALFDRPGFSSVSSVYAWKYSEQYLKAKGYPGIVNGYANEKWKDLRLWDWTKLRALNYAPLLDPMRHWLRFGNPAPGKRGLRYDALHFVWDNSNRGQLVSGDEPGEHFVAELAKVAREEKGVLFAEAYDREADVQRFGIIATPGGSPDAEFERISDHDHNGVTDKRFKGEAGDFLNGKQGDYSLFRYLFGNPTTNTRYLLYGFGHMRGPVYPQGGLKRMEHTNGEIYSFWDYRLPDPEDEDYLKNTRWAVDGYVRHLMRAAQAATDGTIFEPEHADSLAAMIADSTDKFVHHGKDGSVDIHAAASPSDWFHEPWGRDTFLSLPGILALQGRYEESRKIFLQFAEFESGGLIPNRIWSRDPEIIKAAKILLKERAAFLEERKTAGDERKRQIFGRLAEIEAKLSRHPLAPDPGYGLEYNNADASMFFIQALKIYVEQSGDPGALEFARGLAPVVQKILDAYNLPKDQATAFFHRHNERREIYADEDGLTVQPAQASWMDAEVGGVTAATPRSGKTVETNALKYSAHRFLEKLYQEMGQSALSDANKTQAEKIKEAFKKFKNPAFFEKKIPGATPYFDVIMAGTPEEQAKLKEKPENELTQEEKMALSSAAQGAMTRPNMLFAVTAGDLLTLEEKRAVIGEVDRVLMTPLGPRTLSPEDPYHYKGDYARRQAESTKSGDNSKKDEAYHQGPVWLWLIGPYVDAVRETWRGTPETFRDDFVKKTLAPFLTYWMTETPEWYMRVKKDPEDTMAYFTPGLPEIADGGEQYELLDGKGRMRSHAQFVQRPGGTPKQAWSEAMVVYLLVKYGIVSREKIVEWSRKIAAPYAVVEENKPAGAASVAQGQTHKIRAKVYIRDGVPSEHLTVQLIYDSLENWGQDWKNPKEQVLKLAGIEHGAYVYEAELHAAGKVEYKVRVAAGVQNDDWRWEWKYAEGNNGQVEFAGIARSELRFVRSVAREVVKRLSLEETVPLSLWEKVSWAAQDEEFPEAISDAAGSPEIAEMFAVSVVSAKGAGKTGKFYEKHPDHEKASAKFWRDKIRQMNKIARKHLSNRPNAELNFSFAMPLPDSAATRKWFLNYADMIVRLRAKFPGRVNGAVRLLATRSQIDDKLNGFWQKTGRTGFIKAIQTGTKETSYHVDSFLREYGNALVYGHEFEVSAQRKNRLVRVAEGVDAQTVSGVAGLLSLRLADVQGILGEETLRQVADILPGLKYSSQLQITPTAMELVYKRVQLGRLFAIYA